LEHKFRRLAELGVDDVDALYERFTNLASKSPDQIAKLFDFTLT
jgi:hypothetical protein